MKIVKQAWRDERGIETLEWIVVGALIVALATAVYQGALTAQLTAAVNAIGATLVGLAGLTAWRRGLFGAPADDEIHEHHSQRARHFDARIRGGRAPRPRCKK
jgi:hypothetical protein